MLTPTDIHYLVAFLSSVGQPEDVELELGALVLDKSTGTTRDVDVCVKRRTREGVEWFLGIEVKAEGRPLDVIHVEQLCAKMNDMPSLTGRSIVSASGFTGPAAQKAKYHGVELLRIDDLDPSRFTNGLTVISPDFKIKNDRFNPDFTVTFDVVGRDGTPIEVKPSARVLNPDGAKDTDVSDVMALAKSIGTQVAAMYAGTPAAAEMNPGDTATVDQFFPFAKSPFLVALRSRYPIRGAKVTGIVTRKVDWIAPRLKTLIKHDGDVPFVDCVVAEMPDGELLLLATQGVPSRVAIREVPLSARNREKIRTEKWPSVRRG